MLSINQRAGGAPPSSGDVPQNQRAGGAAMPLFSWTLKSKKLLQYLSHRMFAARAWSIKCRRKEKLIAQFGGKLRDERFKPN